MIEKNKDVHKLNFQKPTCMLHAPCSMLLMLQYFLKFREMLLFSLFYARTLLLRHYYYYYYYYIRRTYERKYLLANVCSQVSGKGERGS